MNTVGAYIDPEDNLLHVIVWNEDGSIFEHRVKEPTNEDLARLSSENASLAEKGSEKPVAQQEEKPEVEKYE